MSQASGDALSVVSKTEEPARASSVSADDEPETSGAHSNAAPQDTPHSRSRVQVSPVNFEKLCSTVCHNGILQHMNYKGFTSFNYPFSILCDRHPELRQQNFSHMFTYKACRV